MAPFLSPTINKFEGQVASQSTTRRHLAYASNIKIPSSTKSIPQSSRNIRIISKFSDTILKQQLEDSTVRGSHLELRYQNQYSGDIFLTLSFFTALLLRHFSSTWPEVNVVNDEKTHTVDHRVMLVTQFLDLYVEHQKFPSMVHFRSCWRTTGSNLTIT